FHRSWERRHPCLPLPSSHQGDETLPALDRVSLTIPLTRGTLPPMPSLELLIAQILTILIAARLIGWLFRKINQPRVIGEMVAGILLGPSLFGWVAPDLHATLFPPASLGYLSSLSY